MKSIFHQVLAVWIVMALTGVAASRERFVAQEHPQADDQNPGTETLPLKTIPAAVAQAQPGEVVASVAD
ncbi:MAG: hypothetical protein NTY19_16825 [Planctomycetota bacterium]|nr:hypothetical protein [Planctomycetota bacterium]